jgi:hypothetical protein
VPDKLLKQCSVLWACADYGPSRVASGPEDGNHMPKHVGVEKIWNVFIKFHYFLERLLVVLQTITNPNTNNVPNIVYNVRIIVNGKKEIGNTVN